MCLGCGRAPGARRAAMELFEMHVERAPTRRASQCSLKVGAQLGAMPTGRQVTCNALVQMACEYVDSDEPDSSSDSSAERSRTAASTQSLVSCRSRRSDTVSTAADRASVVYGLREEGPCVDQLLLMHVRRMEDMYRVGNAVAGHFALSRGVVDQGVFKMLQLRGFLCQTPAVKIEVVGAPASPVLEKLTLKKGGSVTVSGDEKVISAPGFAGAGGKASGLRRAKTHGSWFGDFIRDPFLRRKKDRTHGVARSASTTMIPQETKIVELPESTGQDAQQQGSKKVNFQTAERGKNGSWLGGLMRSSFSIKRRKSAKLAQRGQGVSAQPSTPPEVTPTGSNSEIREQVPVHRHSCITIIGLENLEDTLTNVDDEEEVASDTTASDEDIDEIFLEDPLEIKLSEEIVQLPPLELESSKSFLREVEAQLRVLSGFDVSPPADDEDSGNYYGDFKRRSVVSITSANMHFSEESDREPKSADTVPRRKPKTRIKRTKSRELLKRVLARNVSRFRSDNEHARFHHGSHYSYYHSTLSPKSASKRTIDELEREHVYKNPERIPVARPLLDSFPKHRKADELHRITAPASPKQMQI
ncbi:AaceriAGL312Wp [[Ashbya] aceris (nom. inval.)]|nr:AaceriAGL312Wp [[Ashbya] aceris (nom. inval.)]